MNHFHVWVNLKPEADPREFSHTAQEFLGYLHAHELIEGYYLARREFMISPPSLGEYHVTIEFASTDQINRAFAAMEDQDNQEVQGFYRPVADLLRDVWVAMYRDFPESVPLSKRG